LRPDVYPPVLNGCLVSLDRSGNRDLRGPPQFLSSSEKHGPCGTRLQIPSE
jgi:hypothetical protein